MIKTIVLEKYEIFSLMISIYQLNLNRVYKCKAVSRFNIGHSVIITHVLKKYKVFLLLIKCVSTHFKRRR